MKKINRIFIMMGIALIAITLSIQSFALNNNQDGGVNILSESQTSKIEKFIEEQMDKGKVPGMSVVVVKGDKTIYEKGFGYGDIESKKTVKPETLFELGSNSKAFTALGVLKLQSDGLININEPVTKHIPWLKMKYKGKEVSITIEQFLHQTSGVPFKTIANIPISSKDDALEETIKTMVNIELDSYPGSRFQYATINYDVLGLVIEKVTGKSYEEYIKENVLNPLNLNNTYLFRDEAALHDMATGYKIGFLKPRKYEAPMYRGNKPAGYYISNAEDISKWLKIQLGTDKDNKFDKDLVKESHIANRRVAPLGDGASYADGWFVYQKGGGEISHGASNPNYSSFIVFRPEENIGVAVLCNSNSPHAQVIGQGVIEILQGNQPKKTATDINKSVDIISIAIICMSIPIIIVTFYFMFIGVKQLIKKERKFQIKSVKVILGLIFSMLFMIGLTYCIYLIPYILYNGVSWKFVYVWLPANLKISICLLYATIWIAYIYFIFTRVLKKKQDKSLVLIGILSAISGLGNSLIIITINMAITSSNELRVKLLVYFVLGIILYVYGQRLVSVRLIEITNNIVYSKRMEIVKKILKTSYDSFEKIESGRIQATLNNDTETISNLANIVIVGVTSLVTLICCFIYLGIISFYGLLLSVLIIAVIASLYYMVGRYANRVGEEARDIQNIFFKFINDFISGFKELSLNENKKNEFQMDMQDSCNNYRLKRVKAGLAFANMFVIGELLFTIAIGAVVFIFPLVFKDIERGSLVSYVFVLLYMTGPVHGILNAIPNAIQVKISFKRINEMLNQISLMKSEELDEQDLMLKNDVKLKLKGVEYEYDSTEDRKFKVGPIDYEFKSGEIVFITGGNGSGKSTLAKLITGLYMPTEGNITLNSMEISGKALSQYYSTIFSDFYLFNKLYGVDCKSKENGISKYLKILKMDDKVEIKDGKFSTIKLSTGQKKRLALLISYLEDKPIYLFDEWAADQDPEFRKFFYETLLPDLKERGKCVLAITHDDHYFNLADKVIKMEMGKLV
ncbi:cyclic peptide export ABC transporter [Clostridium sp. FP1]|uniref:cyclic peptide export ABC transporter n=1 Tax=Clostridium sp. FP1 TaxID=2724076 RepID=UPI0013E96474|nr:cyclic peptide export ABC transporter [Clostridium sp. FP1]MBZ9636380.1 cyclic peptide export ABC transporter [Clostridium sp. FP1]